MKWIIITFFLLLFFSGIGQIRKTFLENRYWYVYFPCVTDSSALFSDSVIISNRFPENLVLLCYPDLLPHFDFTDSVNFILSHSEKIDTITYTDASPPYITHSTVFKTLRETHGTWQVTENNLMIIKLEDIHRTLIFDVVLFEDRIILYKKNKVK